jgi:hypothetical protein
MSIHINKQVTRYGRDNLIQTNYVVNYFPANSGPLLFRNLPCYSVRSIYTKIYAFIPYSFYSSQEKELHSLIHKMDMIHFSFALLIMTRFISLSL